MQIFDSYIDAGQAMGKRDRESYYAAVIDYLYYGIEPDVNGAALAVFTAIRPSLDISRQRACFGRKGGKANGKQTVKQTAKQKRSKTASKSEANGEANSLISTKQNCENRESKTPKIEEANSNSNSNKEVLTNVSTKKAPVFIKPTIEQISDYAAEIGHPDFDAGRFYDHYEANGWKAGRVAMKDWQATLRNWIRRDNPKDSDLSPELQSLIDMQEGWCGDE